MDWEWERIRGANEEVGVDNEEACFAVMPSLFILSEGEGGRCSYTLWEAFFISSLAP